MKFSTRKKLLKDADLILAEIHKSVKKSKVKSMNEIDWEKHEKWLADDEETAIDYKSIAGTKYMIDTVTRIKLKQLEDKYSSLPPTAYTPEQKEKEIDEMLKDIDIIRQHITKRERIPKDSKLQNDVQKVLANRPVITPKEMIQSLKQNPNEEPLAYTDPVTGLLWHYNVGAPMAPMEWYALMAQHSLDSGGIKKAVSMVSKGIADNASGIVEWDKSRSWLWNIFNKITSLPDFSD
jgi:hypothetical protein